METSKRYAEDAQSSLNSAFQRRTDTMDGVDLRGQDIAEAQVYATLALAATQHEANELQLKRWS